MQNPNDTGPMTGRYFEVIRKIESVRDRPAQIDSFEKMRLALRTLGPDWGSAENILVAGTNGKGSVAKTLETLLSASGENVGLFTSPHLISTTERIRSHGKDLSEDEFVAAYENIREIADTFQLSHFGTLTLMMAEVFFMDRIRPRVDRAVIEVGVGGRLDPTRLFPHAISVVTKLGYDHENLLGGTLDSIAFEKFSIIDEGNLLIHAPLPSEVKKPKLDGLFAKARKRVETKTFPFVIEKMEDSEGVWPVWCIQTPWGSAPLSLSGKRAVENTSIALTVMSELGFDLNSLLPSLSKVIWPGRMEKFLIDGKRVFLSGDHNLQGVETLSEILSQFQYTKLRILAGIGGNKPALPILEALSSLRDSSLYLTVTPFRSTALENYGEWWNSSEYSSVDIESSLKKVFEDCAPEDIILVTGSLYLVGDVRKRLQLLVNPTI